MIKKTLSSRLKIFASSALLSAAVVCPTLASAAKDKRVSCSHGSGDAAPIDGQLTWKCTWEDSSDFRAADIDTLNVHLAATQGFMVRACASYWNTSGGTCGTSDTVDTNGLAQPGLTAWDRTGDFMYVAVDGYQAIQSVRGIYAYIN